MRAFFGLELPESSRQTLSEIRVGLDGRSALPPLRWTPLRHLHLTVRFLGELEESTAGDLLATLPGLLESFGTISVRLRDMSWFPSRRPSVLAVEVDLSDRLLQLFEIVEETVVDAGLPPESRTPNPHITLARIKGRSRGRMPEVRESVEIVFESNELVLFESRLSKQGASYSHYGVVPLRGVPSA